MSDKTKKFEPSIGWIVSVNHQQVSIMRVAEALKIRGSELGQALDDAGYQLTPDTFNLVSDCWKLLRIEETRNQTDKPNLEVVSDEQ